MAQYTQRESGGWEARIRRKGLPTQSRTFATKKKAEEWAVEVETRMNKGLFISTAEAERTTFSEFLKRFKTEFAEEHYRKREDGMEAWKFQCDRLDEFFGEYALVAIDQTLVARYRDDRIKPPASSKRQPVAASTVRKEVFMLSKILDFAQKECNIVLPRGNPVDNVRKPKEGAPRERRLNETEFAALEKEVAKSRNKHLKPAFEFAVATAMRQNEMLTMEWSAYDKKRRIVMLADPNKIKNSEPRPVPLSSAAISVLDALPRPIDGGLVFPVNRQTLYHAFIAACQRAKINDFTWHDLRHEALSRLAERGDLSLLELASISGHKTLQMLKRYTHIQAESLARKLG